MSVQYKSAGGNVPEMFLTGTGRGNFINILGLLPLPAILVLVCVWQAIFEDE